MRPVVLLYHRVGHAAPDPWGLTVAPEHFAEHLDVLRRRAHPVRLEDALSDDARPGSVAVTFDDGYSDNFTTARPLLERFDVPAIVFVTTGCLDAEAFWWDELCGLVFGKTEDASWRAWENGLTPSRAGYRSTWESLRTLNERERRRALDAMGREPREAGSERRPLTTGELVALSQSPLVDIGCHTQTHPVLAALDIESQRVEIAGSCRDLETLIGRTPASFSYPYGRPGDYSAATVELVREAGFHVACTNHWEADGGPADPLQIPRIHVDDCDGDEFSRRLSGWLGAS